MPFTLPLTLNNVYLRSGSARTTFDLPNQLRPQRPFDGLDPFGVFIHWPRAQGWLSLAAEVFPSAGGLGSQFAATSAGLATACRAHNVDPGKVAPAGFIEANLFLIGSVPRLNRLLVTVEVDTDAPGFLELATKPRPPDAPALVLPVHLMFFDGRQFNTLVTQAGQVQLTFLPCTPHPRFEGAVAVDLGNTFTTFAVAAINSRQAVHRTASIELLPVESGGTEGTDSRLLPTVAWLHGIHTRKSAVVPGKRRFPSLPQDELPGAVDFDVGRTAIQGAQGEHPEGAVFGIKQLLSVPEVNDAPGTFDVNIAHVSPDHPHGQLQSVAVLNRLPGELVFTHVFRAQRRLSNAWPADVVLTYPTTYSRRELGQLARAAARGWLRAMGEPQSPGGPPTLFTDPEVQAVADQVRGWLATPADPEGEIAHSGLVRLAIDEATAAAFFHIYRRVLEQTGGARRFRYLCPAGLRALIIDCGGGTTDVALVRAHAPAQDAGAHHLNLEVDVLARSGVRDFGGDHITREVCRLIKAKIALLAIRTLDPARLKGRVPELPPAAPAGATAARKAVDTFLQAVAALDPEDRFVPTRFTGAPVDASTSRRRTAFHALWQLGDTIKAKLGQVKGPLKLREAGRVFFQAETSPLLAEIVRPLEPGARERLIAQMQELTVARWEVDVLVRDRIDALVNKCNRLIERKLAPGDRGPEEEVDWVVLSGNGARYPLFGEVLRAGLDVAYLDDPGRFTFDPENMKHAVAKGAAMARVSQRVASSVPIRFNRNLSKLLPYDILWHDARGNEPRPLFAEFTPYRDIADAWKPLAGWRSDGDGQPVTLILERRFPGDNSCSRYASYEFPEGLAEPEVRYDPYNERFEVRDAASQWLGHYTDLTDPGEHLAPASSGDF